MPAMSSDPTPVRLSVSLVVYHSDLARLAQTLSSLRLAIQEADKEGSLAGAVLIVVDNSGDDAYGESVQRVLADVMHDTPGCESRYQRADQNLGYGAGHNDAIAGVSSDLHLVLNPDVELAPDALALGIADFAHYPNTVLLAPRVHSGNGTREYLCRSYPSVLVLAVRAFGPAFVRSWFAEQLADYELRALCDRGERATIPLASGCFMLLRTSAFKAVDGFDPRYFLYFEDYDLSRRLFAEGELAYQPAVQITHHGGYAVRKGLRHLAMFVRSGLRFFGQYGWRWI